MNITCKPDDIQVQINALEQALARRRGQRVAVSRGLQFADRRKSARDGGRNVESVTTQGLLVTESTLQAFTALFTKDQPVR